jgi:hypothetical protein
MTEEAMLMHCGCDRRDGKPSAGAAFQDGVYGVGVRMHNPTAKDDTYRCTVCGHEQTKGNKKEKEPEKEKGQGKGKKVEEPKGKRSKK